MTRKKDMVWPLAGRPPGLLRHLYHLTRCFTIGERCIPYINIYAIPYETEEGQELDFIIAKESGFEGVACVDDVARAAILALQVYEQTGASTAVQLARGWLDFVLYMQNADGLFTNFIADWDGTKNLSGKTSYATGRWWNARALWALATAWRITAEQQYLDAFLRGHMLPTDDMKIKAVQVLALAEIYQRKPDDDLQQRICTMCDSIAASARDGFFRDRIDRDYVCMWGYHQLQAVARAARLFAHVDYIAACEKTVQTLVDRVIADGFYHIYPTMRDHQCAYDVSTLTLGLEEMYRATHDRDYRDRAMHCLSWLTGNNPAGAIMYDSRTGRCSDGITGTVASANCGAESSIEAGFMELARRRLRGQIAGRKAAAQGMSA